MLTGKRFWTLALVLGLCVLATAGCRRKSSKGTTINTSGVFTTDNFPGAPVQENNVSDDKRAFSTHTDDYDGSSLVCTHNGDRGTIMVTYSVDDQVFAHYYDGSGWTIGVALRHFDTYIGTTDAGEIVHAFINTDDDTRGDAEDRTGDCLIFWGALDFDTDGGAGGDEENFNLYASYFHVRHSAEADLNHGFDIDPNNPGYFYADRISSLEFSGEDVLFQGIVTDGLCGEARWIDGANVYTYGDSTFSIWPFWHENEEKSVGVFDEITSTCGYDLDFVVDEEFPLVPTADIEIVINGFGASDSGVDATETAVGEEYVSYNDILMFRVVSLDGSSFGAVPATVFAGGTDVDTTVQYTHFNFNTFLLTTDWMNTVDPDSDAVSVDDLNSDFLKPAGSFLAGTGRSTFGRDEGLSCLVTFFHQAYDADNTIGGAVVFGDGQEVTLAIAEIDEDTGTLLNDSEPSLLPVDEVVVLNYLDPFFTDVQISRNGDYMWIVYQRRTGLGTFDEFNLNVQQYATTRVDSDGNPVAVPLLSSTLGFAFLFDPEDGGSGSYFWSMFQENLGYICGIQSDAQQMNLFFHHTDSGTGNSLIYHTRLTADVDGAIGSETASSATILIDEDNGGYHGGFQNPFDRSSFNATDAGQDGDIFYVFSYDDNDTNGISDTFIAGGRFGVTAAAPIEMGSGMFERHTAHPSDETHPIDLVATPRGTDIGAWDVTNSQYDGGAHHGAEFVHLFFREAETSSYPFVGTNTTTGYAYRTRVYNTDIDGSTFGDDFTPNAGTTFRKPFDLDLPFIDPDQFDDLEHLAILVCDNTVVLIFEQNGHLYYQEGTPSDNSDDETGWREEAIGVSDPALIDDDTTELLAFFEEVCTRSCTCCDIDGAAIFWVKNLDDGSGVDRLQVRLIDGENN